MPSQPSPSKPEFTPAVSIALGEFYKNLDYEQIKRDAGRTAILGTGPVKMPDNGFPLLSGKRGALLDFEGEPGPRQGRVLALVVGDETDYRHSPPSGNELWRPHSSCKFSLVGIAWTKLVQSQCSEIEPLLKRERWERWYEAQLKSDPSRAVGRTEYIAGHLRDLFAILRAPSQPRHDCDCREQGLMALEEIIREGGGFLDLVDQEARGHGLDAKLAIYALQALGYESDEACAELGLEYDVRDFSHCTRQLLYWDSIWERDLTEISLMTNSSFKHEEFNKNGIRTIKRPHIHGINKDNEKYLRMKTRHGHEIPEEALRTALEA